VGEHFAGDSLVRICSVDCTAHHKECGAAGVKGFPTMKVFHATGEPASMEEKGFEINSGGLAKGTAGIIAWIEGHAKAPLLLVAPPPSGGSGGSSGDRSGSSSPQGQDANPALLPARPRSPEAAGHALAEVGRHAHDPMRPSVMLAHSGRRWDPHTAVDPAAGGSPARARLGDAAASLLFGLHYGVFVDGPTLGEGQRRALADFLGVLAKAFPGPATNRAALAALRTRVLGTQSSDAAGGTTAAAAAVPAPLTAPLSSDDEWMALLATFRLQGRVSSADDLDWTANCDPSKRVATVEAKGGSSPGGAGRHITVGYTCGLWTLFHMVTLAAPRAGLTPREATGAIRNYVEHFFGCAHCRDHFLALYDGCDFGRCDVAVDASPPSGGKALHEAGEDVPDPAAAGGDRGLDPGAQMLGAAARFRADAEAFGAAHRQTALWLWKAHNEVNRRVAVEALEDEAERHGEAVEANGHGGRMVKEPVRVVDLDPAWALWPPPDMCPACWVRGQPLGAAAAATARAAGDGGGDAKGQGRGFEAAEWDEEEVLAFLTKAYDVGLWERGPAGSERASPGIMAAAEASRDRLAGMASDAPT
jgi:hypothetical protein